MSYWYQKCMPRIKDVKPHIPRTIKQLLSVDGMKGIYIWGSYARNINNPNHRLKDIDVLVETKFVSGDLLAIDNKIINANYDDEFLENQGFSPYAIKFSKCFTNLKKYNVDCWAISSDKSLLHWGPILKSKTETDLLNKEAEEYASQLTGIAPKKIQRASEKNRNNWFNIYCHYKEKCFDGMPSGWYKTDEIRIKNLLHRTIKI